jgi:maleate isomerase
MIMWECIFLSRGVTHDERLQYNHFYFIQRIMLAYGSKGLLGVLTPQANTTVEAEFWALLPTGMSLLNARMCSPKQSIEERLRDYFEHLEQHASQFGNAPIQALSVACTGSSYLAGKEQERSALQALSDRLQRPVTTSGLAMVHALKSLGASRIGLISPYPADLTAHSVTYWQSHGLEVVRVENVLSEAHNATFHPIYTLPSHQASLPVERLSQLDIDAIAMLGTGMPTLAALTLANRNQPRLPVISCMLATVWWSCRLINKEIPGLGHWLLHPHWLNRMEGLL